VRGKPRLFLDASVLIAAVGSERGGSSLVLAICRENHAQAVSSRIVLLEAERNIRRKLGADALLRFYQQVANLDLELVSSPTPDESEAQARIINSKDAHVLAAALKGRVDVLLTLDRKHFLVRQVRAAGLPFAMMTPGDYLRSLVR
jgi:predicted nucleic acid-binding protein